MFFPCTRKNAEALLELLVFDMFLLHFYITYDPFIFFTNAICSLRPAPIALVNIKVSLYLLGILDSFYPANYYLLVFFFSPKHTSPPNVLCHQVTYYVFSVW